LPCLCCQTLINCLLLFSSFNHSLPCLCCQTLINCVLLFSSFLLFQKPIAPGSVTTDGEDGPELEFDTADLSALTELSDLFSGDGADEMAALLGNIEGLQ
jgi:hypothetical protein